MVVQELVAELGLDVKADTFAAGQKGLDALERIALSLSAVIDRLDGKLAGVGAKMAGAAEASALGAGGGSKAALAAESLAMMPALPPGYNKALEDEKAKILQAREAAVLHTQAVKDLGEKHEEAHTGIDHAAHAVEGLVAGFLALEGVHLLREFAEQMVTLGTSIERTSLRLGITTEAVQQLRYAAGQFNVDASTLDNGLRFLQVNAVAAAKGSKEQAAAFKSIGVAVKDSAGNIRGTEDLFMSTAQGLADIQDPAKRTAEAVKIFGRGANEMIPFLAQGAEGIQKYREEAEKLGGGFSEEAVQRSADLEHATKRLDFAMLSLKGRIAEAILPAFEAITEKGIKLAAGLRSLTQNVAFFETVLGVGLVFTIYKAVTALAAMTAAQWAQVRATAAAIGEFALVIAGVLLFAAVVDDLYTFLTGGKSVIGDWLDSWAGVGAADEMVRNWKVGIDDLKTSLIELGQTAARVFRVITDPVGSIDDAINGAGTSDLSALWESAKTEVIGSAVSGFGGGIETRDPIARASGRGVGANAVYDQGTPRAVARGLTAGLQDGSGGFGQASASALRGGGPVDASTNIDKIEVNVKTDASAPEIAHAIDDRIRKHTNAQHKQVRAAHVPAPDPV